jgi:hypothetical protein
MILNPKTQESENFTQLFYEIVCSFLGLFLLRRRLKPRLQLAMQHFQEAATWFPINAEDYLFHLSMRSQGHQEGTGRIFPSMTPQHTSVGFAGTASAVSPSLLTPTSGISGLSIASPITDSFPGLAALPQRPPLLPQPPQRIPLPRLNSYPPAGANGRPTPRSTAVSSTNNSPPSPVTNIPPGSDAELKPGLVKHLQKVHGLTKKRNYGLQASRAPFIRDETAAAPYPPTHSVDPANGRPRRNTGVHASKNKKGDDPRRPRRGSVHVGFPESARVSSPDSDSSTSGAPSPTATVAGMLGSPAGPVSVGLQMAMPVSTPPQHNLVAEAAGYGTVPPPPLWQNETLVQAQAQAAVASANPAPAFTNMLPPQQLTSQAHALPPAQVQAQAQAQQTRTNVRAAAVAPLASSSYSNLPHGNPDSLVAYSTTTTAASGVGSSYVSQQPSVLHTTSSAVAPVAAAAPTTDDGDKPFIFYPEYEDALMPQAPLFAPLSAAAQPTPMTQFWPTASADYAHILNPATTPGLLRGNPTPDYDMSVYDSHVHPQPALSHVNPHVQPGVVYASEQSSSLQSWADY